MTKFKFPLGKGVYYVQCKDEKVQYFLSALQESAYYMRTLLPARVPEFDSFLYSIVNSLNITQLDVAAMEA